MCVCVLQQCMVVISHLVGLWQNKYGIIRSVLNICDRAIIYAYLYLCICWINSFKCMLTCVSTCICIVQSREWNCHLIPKRLRLSFNIPLFILISFSWSIFCFCVRQNMIVSCSLFLLLLILYINIFSLLLTLKIQSPNGQANLYSSIQIIYCGFGDSELWLNLKLEVGSASFFVHYT